MTALWLLFSLAFAQDRGARGDDAAYAADDDTYVPAPKRRLWYSNAFFGRVNPLGLSDIHKVGLRHRLSTKDSILFRDTYAFVGANALITPAYTRVGASGEAQLLAILRFFVDVAYVGYYGNFDQVMTFAPDAKYSDQTIESRSGENAPTTGWTLNAGATLRFKVGPIAARSTAQVTRFDLAGLGDQYFYDQFWDRLAPNGGWMFLNDFDVLYVGGKLRAGLRHTYSDNLDGSGGSTDAALSHHRLGPLIAFQLKDKAPGAKFNQPTIFVLSQWWLQHPYRTGQEQPAGLPVIAIGFAFNGDYAVSKD